jgi:hypothetical protein
MKYRGLQLNTGINGFVAVTIDGTLLDAVCSGGTFHLTGYSEGEIKCRATPTPWSHGQGWGAFNQVA